MAKQKSKATPAEDVVSTPVEPLQPVEEQEAEATRETPSKMDLVREALAAGIEKPAEIASWALATYGVELDPKLITVYKAKLSSGSPEKRAYKRRQPAGDIGSLLSLGDRLRQATREMPEGQVETVLELAQDIAEAYQLHGKENVDRVVSWVRQ